MTQYIHLIADGKQLNIISKLPRLQNEVLTSAFLEATGTNPTQEAIQAVHDALSTENQQKWDAFVKENGNNVWVVR